MGSDTTDDTKARRARPRLIGVLGGISPVSTAYYLDLLHEATRDRLGAPHSARCLVHCVDFGEVERCYASRDWVAVTRILVEAAQSLEAGGAECVVLACNTMHRVAAALARAIAVPFLDIRDATASRVRAAGCRRLGLLGTKYTMDSSLYRGHLAGTEIFVPDGPGRDRIHDVIQTELCEGVMGDAQRGVFLGAIESLQRDHGIDGVVLGCTEIGVLLRDCELPVRAFDTARIHVADAVRWAAS